MATLSTGRDLNPGVVDTSIIAIQAHMGQNHGGWTSPPGDRRAEALSTATGTNSLCLCESRPSVFVQRPMDRVRYARHNKARAYDGKPATGVFGSRGRPSSGVESDRWLEVSKWTGDCRLAVGGEKHRTALSSREWRRISPWRLGRHNAAEIWRLLWNYCPSVGIQSVS